MIGGYAAIYHGYDCVTGDMHLWLEPDNINIDFLTKVSNVNFEDAFKEANFFTVENYSILVIQYHHLILTRLTTGRAKDKADIEELKKIQRYRGRNM